MTAPAPPTRTGDRSFTATARRAQIVDATITAIAELGYPQASFARIAAQAGLSSTRLISYHFAGKEELIAEVVTHVTTDMGQFVAERMRGQDSAASALRTYLRTMVDYTATHRTEMKALLEVFLHGAFRYDAADDRAVMSQVEEILRTGQDRGEFRAFDTRVMAAVVQRAVEGLPFLLEAQPDLDPEVYAAEITTLFDLATRRPPERSE